MSELDLLRGAIVFFAAGALATGCGAEFTTGGSSSGGTTGTAGMSTTTTGSGGTSGATTSTSAATGGGGAGGGTSGTSGTGGATSTGSGGTGGMVPPPCVPGKLSTCPSGEYCDAGTGMCTSCAQSSTFSFAAPTALGITDPYPPNALFPRIGPGGQLLFRLVQNQKSDIGFALPVAPMTWASAMFEPSPLINTPSFNEEGPLFLPVGTALGGLVSDKVDIAKPVLLFDSNKSGERRIYAANLDGLASSLVDLKTQSAAYQVAVAYDLSPARFWYYNNLPAVPPGPQLGTSVNGDDPVPVPVLLDNGCHARGELTPWVTPDGQWMFLSAQSPNPAGCVLQADAPNHLFFVPLDGSGLPKGGMAAQAIFPNAPNSQVSPSLSPDQCTLYFSEIGAVKTLMYGAVRK